jgi:hypothetical protein
MRAAGRGSAAQARRLVARAAYWAPVARGVTWRLMHPVEAAAAERALEALGPAREDLQGGAEPADAVPRWPQWREAPVTETELALIGAQRRAGLPVPDLWMPGELHAWRLDQQRARDEGERTDAERAERDREGGA